MACENCGVGVCSACDVRWKAEADSHGCPVCREVGDGFEFAEYGGEDMLGNIKEAVERIEECFRSKVE